MSDPPSSPGINIYPSIDQRYGSATIEKGARIQARQIVQLTYVTILTTLVATLISGKFELQNIGNYSTFVFIVGIPCLAAIVAAWCGNQDSVIALLDSFCYQLEEVGRSLSTHTGVPRWYDPSGPYFPAGIIGRYWSNVAFGACLFGASLPGTLIGYMIGYKQSALICEIGIVCFAIFYRFVRMPASRQRGVVTRYHFVTVALFVVLVVMLLIFNHMTFREPLANHINYPYHLLVATGLASCMPLAVHFEFERRRLVFLAANELPPGPADLPAAVIAGSVSLSRLNVMGRAARSANGTPDYEI